MKRAIVITLISSLFTYGMVAQDIPVIEKYEPGSILKIGTAPIGFMNHSGISVLNLSLAYEFKMGSRFSGQVNVISDLLGRLASGEWDIESQRRQIFSSDNISYFTRNSTTLNFDFRYYFGKSGNATFDGPYLGVRVNNLLSNGTEFSGGRTTAVTRAMPAIGIYLGYQKVFRNNMFIDINVGFVPEGQFRFKQNDFGLPMDANLSFGYRFKSLKSREERKLQKLNKR